jgi:maleylacetate reductase
MPRPRGIRNRAIAGLAMPRSLGAVKVGPESFARLAERGNGHPWVPRNPRPIAGPAQVREILVLAA